MGCEYKAPQPADWINAHRGRILFVSSFDARQYSQDLEWAQTVIQIRRQRGNGGGVVPKTSHDIGFVYGRHHVESIGYEGSSVEGDGGDAECPVCAAECHRCVGQYGGHPDLLAWDVVEWLWTGMDSIDHTYAPRPFVQDLLVLLDAP